MKFNNNRIFCLLFCLLLGGANLTAQNLMVCSVEFPDTVTIGETATLMGYVVNKDNIVYTDDIIVNIDIEDVAPAGLLNDGEVNESITINQSNLAPNDSVFFEKELLINPQEFGVAGTDLIVIWPQASANDGFIDNEADIQLTFVQDEAEIDTEILNRSVEFDYLPESIIAYISTHYPNVSIDYVCTVQTNFKIKLDNDELLIFSIDGKLQDMSDDVSRNVYYDDDDESFDYDEDDDYADDDDDDGKDDDDDDYGDDDDDDGKDYDDDDYGDDDDDDSKDDDDDGTDDDDGKDDDDDNDGKDDDDDDSGDDDDDGMKLSDSQLSAGPFKIISKNNLITIVALHNYNITSLELFDLNGKSHGHLVNNALLAQLNLNVQQINSQLMVLRIYAKDANGKSLEFSKKINVGF